MNFLGLCCIFLQSWTNIIQGVWFIIANLFDCQKIKKNKQKEYIDIGNKKNWVNHRCTLHPLSRVRVLNINGDKSFPWTIQYL